MRNIKPIQVAVILAGVMAASAVQADWKELLKGVVESQIATPAAPSGTASPASPGAVSATSGVAGMVASGVASGGLSQAEIVNGLKEALAKGAQSAIANLGKEGGFMNNVAVKIPMPEGLAAVEKTLRQFGQDKYADQFVTTMNRAAEKAVPEAAAIFAESIREMSLEDAQAILKGPNDAATQYFRKKSEAKLAERFKVIVTQATDQAGVTSAYKKMVKKAGPWVSMLGAGTDDLDAYVTAKSLDGLFKMVAEEEKNIRANPVARSTDLLKKVFGSVLK